MVKDNIVRMHEIDFNFDFNKKNYPKVRRFLMRSIKTFCKKNILFPRFSQNDINEMVRVAV